MSPKHFIKLISLLICFQAATVSALTCYSCVNCQFAIWATTPIPVTCSTNATYCMTVQLKFPDSITDRLCSPICSSASATSPIYEIDCCQTNNCNAAESTLLRPHVTAANGAMAVIGLASSAFLAPYSTSYYT